MNPATLEGRSLLTWLDFQTEEIRYFLDLSAKLKTESRTANRTQRFAGMTLAMLFEKRSTRTRCAFETAFGEEGGHPVFLSTQDIQLGSKESVEDTARVLGRMFNAIEFRGFKQQTVQTLADYSGVPVYNGLTDLFHPTQALADLLTIEESFGECTGKKLCFIGDGRNNVARSLMVISAKMGLNFTITSPQELFPDQELVRSCTQIASKNGSSIIITDDLDSVRGADALYTDVWVSMGEEKLQQERRALLKPYQVNDALMDRTGKSTSIFLHCLPAVKEEEVSTALIDGPRSRAWDQAENRKHTIKAIMAATLGV
jgi:ornithine carbamoyltransferase